MTKKVIVTGGAGFIGSHVCDMYVAEGYDVLCVDDLSSGKLENIEQLRMKNNFHFVHADITDKERMMRLFARFKPDMVNHHAAQKSVAASLEDPNHDLNINGKGLLVLLSCIQKHPIDNFIYVSSGGALSKEISSNEKSKEEDRPQLISPYAITKYAGEKYLAVYSQLFQFDYTVLRYANVFGPRQIPDGECGVIPIFARNVLDDKISTLMTYPDMPRGCTRDYVYVSDVAEANRLASHNPANTVINIGSGKEVAILDIYEAILEAFGKEIAITISGPRLGDVKRSVLLNDRAKEVWDWTPKISLEEGLGVLAANM
ncbi:SDR family NAD(P)-dependent oxidoreductase [Listeria costaricensis]|uniref:SDR family NAD(P)-dependent oxidoreductase n=1 Tax=Listeria costaricensis TaxID=2026604 RepID=UPI000C06ADF5|nr:SDR family NAD(P)-dependent oxidoreductase [Listeria costaricensis]